MRQNASPGFDPARYAMPAAPTTTVSLTAPDTASGGQRFTASATVRVAADAPPAFDVKPALTAPAGWTVGPASPPSVAKVDGGRAATFTWPVTAPSTVDTAALKVTVAYRQAGRPGSASDERIVGAVPPAPPAGQVAVSSLPFLTATNGWGPVERDTSNGEANAGDGKPMTIGGVAYAKGLGTHAASDVQLYLAGACTRLTASVGVDGETGTGGSVTFSVSADGATKVTTPVVRGGQAAVPIDVDVTGGPGPGPAGRRRRGRQRQRPRGLGAADADLHYAARSVTAGSPRRKKVARTSRRSRHRWYSASPKMIEPTTFATKCHQTR